MLYNFLLCSQNHVSLFLKRPGGVSIGPFLTHGSGGDHKHKVVGPQAANLIKQLE